ncbi:MAG: AAA-like domain-containing protein [Crocosphaera sp.]|nr:AAA-like domain-containing protein [Crocosphaera sp.]
MTQTQTQTNSKKTRKRGVILTDEGLEKLQNAKTEAEYAENHGNRYTLEALSEKTGLAMDTLMKVFACELRVDKQTLRTCFKAFELDLCDQDFYHPQTDTDRIIKCFDVPELELPEGQVRLNSPCYVERLPIESDCYKAILQPGALIRLKAPRRMGKSSLLARIMNHASQNDCATVSLSFHLADTGLFQDLNKFLQWFCANISLNLKISHKVTDSWDDIVGSKINCRHYFKHHILSTLEKDTPLVLGLDDVDRLFQYPELADDFFGLLRTWHEEGKNKDIWQKLRLIVVHSAEVYIPLNVNQSPFNVGIPITLPVFTPQQVKDLAKVHKLEWSLEEAEKLIDFVGGHPYLIRLALYNIYKKRITLEKLLSINPRTSYNIYRDHLQRQLWSLKKQNCDLFAALEKVVFATEPVELDLVQSIKLQSLGLVNFQGHKVVISCRLYQEYFQQHFSEE